MTKYHKSGISIFTQYRGAGWDATGFGFWKKFSTALGHIFIHFKLLK